MRVVPHLVEEVKQVDVPRDIMETCAVLAHDTSEPQPRFVFANRLAAELFEASEIGDLIGMESRRTVDLDDREEQRRRGDLISSANNAVRTRTAPPSRRAFRRGEWMQSRLRTVTGGADDSQGRFASSFRRRTRAGLRRDDSDPNPPLPCIRGAVPARESRSPGTAARMREVLGD